MFRRFFYPIALTMSAFFGPATALDRALIERQFQTWLTEVVEPLAASKGVSSDTFKAAFTGINLNWNLSGLTFPGMAPEIPEQQSQSEFRAPAKYFDPAGMAGTAAIGRRLATKHADTLATIEQSSGVPGRIILAIWARESGYGRVPISHNAFEVLSTRAYASSGDYLTNELVAALVIAETGDTPPNQMKSSWAGALGQPQFMPASYLAYAADGDGDGRKDIWQSKADTMASIANFLAVHEWQAGRDWGYEVTVSESVSCTLEGPDQRKSFEEWETLGIARVSGGSFPDQERQRESSLLFPAGRHGPAFLVTANFYVLKRYNHSDLYALYVGNLGDRIEFGMGEFATPWDSLETIYRSEIAQIQQQLEARGHDVGGADGLPGFKTRRSIGRWQEATGHPATCFPEVWMVEAMAN